MAKFKVGDIAQYNTKYGIYEYGDVVEIVLAFEGFVSVNGKHGDAIAPNDFLELVEPKLTKKHAGRIKNSLKTTIFSECKRKM